MGGPRISTPECSSPNLTAAADHKQINEELIAQQMLSALSEAKEYEHQ